ncbi:MAG: SDR family oxidoreductase [Bdellovibrionales bacterium]|nr:SDR family oxidoreductase [Bdellovibrionales bacterium]
MKTVVITGASQGIGAQLVKSFLEKEFNVVFCARKENEFTKNLPKNAKFLAGDVRKRETHKKLVETAMEWTGRLNVYVNNAGVSQWKPIQDIDEEFLSMMIETNLYGTFWGAQQAAEVMKPGSSIINISSLAGKRGSANNSAYCAAKFGVNGLTQSLAKELGSKGIRVNAVCPVYIKTENLISALSEGVSPTQGQDIEAYFSSFAKSQAALGRLPLAEEISRSCLFLAEEASAITGQCINVDCGVMPQ